MDAHTHTLQAMRRLEVALTATAHFAPADSRLIEDAANATTRELVAMGQTPDAVRRLAAWAGRSGVGLERADLTERLRRAIERTLDACERERRTPPEPLRAVPAPVGDTPADVATTAEHPVAEDAAAAAASD